MCKYEQITDQLIANLRTMRDMANKQAHLEMYMRVQEPRFADLLNGIYVLLDEYDSGFRKKSDLGVQVHERVRTKDIFGST